MVGQFNGFDESIWRVTCDVERGRDIFESLMMEAIDSEDGFAKDLSDTRPHFDFHFVSKLQIIFRGMLKGAGQLIENVSVKRPAEGNIHHLTSAANAEERFVV